MKMTNREYAAHVAATATKTASGKNLVCAFLIGGAICTVGQGLFDIYEALGLTEVLTNLAVPVTLVFLGTVLTALGVYDNIARYGGAGTLVPITGFANAVVSPAMEFKSEGLILGLSARMFTVAGPVIVFGVVASILYGLFVVLFGLPISWAA